MYYKGANMLHTLRQLVDNDEQWRQLLRGINEEFYHQTVTSEQIETFISEKSGKDLTAFFEQYLRTIDIPTLEYEIDGKYLKYRYTNTVDEFDMPLKIVVNNKPQWIYPKKKGAWHKTKIADDKVQFDSNFYIRTKSL